VTGGHGASVLAAASVASLYAQPPKKRAFRAGNAFSVDILVRIEAARTTFVRAG
jgi:hypothetical protein